ncbi:hypothetical protein HII36_36635 [Nonomuraea sp. NN258]|nr:hypothetical protein [Nonomuraea antri]NRQ37324.1 hypothetical protein [Nonomuraea antri]
MTHHVPPLWASAYGSRRPAPVRWPARALLRVADFVRMLALADHQTFVAH